MEPNIYERFKHNPEDVWQREGEREEDWIHRINPNGRLRSTTLNCIRKPKEGQSVGDWKKRFQMLRYQRKFKEQRKITGGITKTVPPNSKPPLFQSFLRPEPTVEKLSSTSTSNAPSRSLPTVEPYLFHSDASNVSSDVNTSVTTDPSSRVLHLRLSGQYVTSIVSSSASSASRSQGVQRHQKEVHPLVTFSAPSLASVATPSSAPAGALATGIALPQQPETDGLEDVGDQDISNFFRFLQSISRDFSNDKLNCFESRISTLQQENRALIATNEGLQDQLQLTHREIAEAHDKLQAQIREKDNELQALKEEMADAPSKLQQGKMKVERLSQIVEESNGQIARLKDQVSSLKQSLEESSTKIIERQVQNILKADQLESQTKTVQDIVCEFEMDMIEMQKRLQLFQGSLPSKDLVYLNESLAKRRRCDD